MYHNNSFSLKKLTFERSNHEKPLKISYFGSVPYSLGFFCNLYPKLSGAFPSARVLIFFPGKFHCSTKKKTKMIPICFLPVKLSSF